MGFYTFTCILWLLQNIQCKRYLQNLYIFPKFDICKYCFANGCCKMPLNNLIIHIRMGERERESTTTFRMEKFVLIDYSHYMMPWEQDITYKLIENKLFSKGFLVFFLVLGFWYLFLSAVFCTTQTFWALMLGVMIISWFLHCKNWLSSNKCSTTSWQWLFMSRV